MSKKKQRIPTAIKILITLLVPLLISAGSTYYFATEVKNADRIYPHVSIAGIDVSGMTRAQAAQSLDLTGYEARINNANVIFTFPDDSKLFVAATSVDMQHNINEIVYLAYSVGRGQDLIFDFVNYIQRQDAEVIDHNIVFTLDKEKLRAIINEFVDNYNERLSLSKPVIYNDRVVFTKGVGHVSADTLEVFELAYNGLFESFENGRPVEITYTLPEVRTSMTEIHNIRRSIFVQTVTSTYDHETDSATKCAVGVDFDAFEVFGLLSNTESGKKTTIPLVFTHPEFSQEYLSSMLYRDLIGQRTTFVHGNDNRLTNVRISSEIINGLILLPGDEFSYNEVVGRRTSDRGFKTAAAIVEGVYVPTIGGGVCQTSSTLYAAIKPSELEVLEQRGHSRSVPYLPRGWDAAVAWGKLDFRFANNTTYPIRIEAVLEGRDLTIKIWGTVIDGFPIATNWMDDAEWMDESERTEIQTTSVSASSDTRHPDLT